MDRLMGQKKYRDRIKEERLAENVCIRCGFSEHLEGRQLCQKCTDKMRKTRKCLVEERKLLRVCIKCGKEDERTIVGLTRCNECADREKIARLKRRTEVKKK